MLHTPVLVTSSVIADTAEADSKTAAAVLRAKQRMATATLGKCGRKGNEYGSRSGQASPRGSQWAARSLGVLGGQGNPALARSWLW